MNPAAPSSPRRILLVKWSALGDVVMATALMEDVARAYPGATIHLNTLPSVAPLFLHDPRFEKIIAIDIRQRGQRLRNSLAWLRQMRAGKYDLVIDLQRTDHTRTLLALWWLTGRAPALRAGNRGGFPYTVQPRPLPRPTHAFAMMRAVLAAVGIPTHTPRPVLHPGETALRQAAALCRLQGLLPGRYAVFLPGSQAAGWLKRWGVENYMQLGRLLHARGLEKIAIIGGPDEVEDCARIAAAGDFMVNLNGKMQLLEIAPVCEGAAFIVGNDTGTAHFAAAADRPMLVICGATDPRRVKPIGEKVRAIQAILPCINCYGKDCINPDYLACMRRLTPESVANELMQPEHSRATASRVGYAIF